MIAVASDPKAHGNVAAFKALRETVEPEEAERAPMDGNTLYRLYEIARDAVGPMQADPLGI
jgi:hypothetical protein